MTPRSKKRKTQYELFIEQFSKSKSKKLREDSAKLGKLWNELKEYMDPDNPKEIDREELRKFLQSYIIIADSFAKNIPEDESVSVAKLRKIMGKDIRVINSKLKSSKANSFNLVKVFDESRSITVKVNQKDIEKTGGNINSRMHIKAIDKSSQDQNNVVDGFFTVHNEPYDFKKEKRKIALELLEINKTDKDNDYIDEDLLAFLFYMLGNEKKHNGKYVSKFTSQFMKDFEIRMSFNTGVKMNSKIIRSLYKTDREAINGYSVAIMNTVRDYFNDNEIEGGDPRQEKIFKFARLISNDKNIDKVMDAGGKILMEHNKNSIMSGTGINKKSRIDKRNSAMSAVADLMGIGYIIAHSENMRVQIGDKELKGTFMNKAEGLDPRKPSDVKKLKKLTAKNFTENGDFIRDLANLQILDFLCGNTDRHMNNMLFKIKKNKTGANENEENENEEIELVGVQGIDNDTSLGSKNLTFYKNILHFVSLKDIRIIPRTTAEKVMTLKPEMLRVMLAGFDLTEEEIENAMFRLDELKEAINSAWAMKSFNEKGVIRKSNKVTLLNIVDEEDMKDISIPKQLYDSKNAFVENVKEGEKENYNLYTRLEIAASYGGFHDNICDECYDKLVDKCSAVREIEKKQKNLLDFFDHPNRMMKTKIEEYAPMITAVKKLKDNMVLSKTDIGPKRLDDIIGSYSELNTYASDAVFYVTSYHSMLQENIQKKENNGKKITQDEKKHLNDIRKIIDNLEELYMGYNSMLQAADKYKTVLVEKKEHVAKAKKEHDELLNAPKKAETLDSFEKINRMLDTDKVILQENMQEIRSGKAISDFLGRAVMVNMIEINSRENYLKLIKGNVPEEERKAMIEDIAVNYAIRRLVVSNEKVSRKFVKNPKLLEAFVSEMRNERRSQPFWDEALKVIENNIEILKNPKTPEDITMFNMLMKNGMGTIKTENNFVNKYCDITSDVYIKMINNAGEKVAKMGAEEKGKNVNMNK